MYWALPFSLFHRQCAVNHGRIQYAQEAQGHKPLDLARVRGITRPGTPTAVTAGVIEFATTRSNCTHDISATLQIGHGDLDQIQ